MDRTAVGLLFIFVHAAITVHVTFGAGPPSGYSTSDESELRTKLYTGYDALQRPEKKVKVDVTLNLLTINSLNIRKQTLSTSGYFALSWHDTRLAWKNDTNYEDINFMFSTEQYTWRPAVLVENSVRDIAVFSDKNTLVRVNPEGQCIWSPGGIYETSCEADVTYYPLDVQTCKITLSTWSYTANEVMLQFNVIPFRKTDYQENGEWEILQVTTESTSTTRESESFSRLHFFFTLRRRPLYHILNTMFPVILMASLTIFVFKLPPESGERIGMSLTVLLAYAVYLTVISNNIPTTSLSASILSTYLTIILMLSALSVVFTIVVLDIFFNHDDQEIPDWLQKLTRNVLANIVCWRGARFWKPSKRVRPSSGDTAEDGQRSEMRDVRLALNGTTPKKRSFASLTRDSDKVDPGAGRLGRKARSSLTPEPDKVYTWKEIAYIMDRFFLYIFVLVVVVCTVVCMALLIGQHGRSNS